MKRPSDSSPAAIATAHPTATEQQRRFTNVCPGSMIGRPGRISWSFPNAMFEPQKETDPTIAEKRIGIISSSGMSPPACRNSAHATSATAPPPTPLNSATICGIAVIFTLRAAGMPTAVPITTPTDDQLPVADLRLAARWPRPRPPCRPRRSCCPGARSRGCVSRCRPMMKSENETMYARRDEVRIAQEEVAMTISRPAPSGRRLLPEHLEHPVGHEEAADHVDRAERDRDHEDHLVERRPRPGRSRAGRRARRSRESRSSPT